MRRTVLGLAVVGTSALVAACGSSSPVRSTRAQSERPRARAAHAGALNPALVARTVGRLPAPVQGPATTALGADAVLLGGLDTADVSVSDILITSRSGARRVGSLPQALHDAAAATVLGRTYLFGGGEPSRSEIFAIAPDGSAARSGQLPVGASDVAAASVGRTAYVVGGYTGTLALDTIVAWSGTGTGRIVARLPQPLRYAAVAADSGRVIIAGGTNGASASRAVYAFDPATGHVTDLALLPRPLTHAAAVALGGEVYVIGGRGSGAGTQTADILAIDAASGRLRSAGRLPVALSDVGAAPVDGGIVVAGGREASGTLSDQVVLLSPTA